MVLKKKILKSQNLSLKIISFILAISLELYFYSPDNSATADISAAVELLDVPNTMVAISPSLETGKLTAKIRIRGPRPLVEKAEKGIYNFTVEYPNNPTTAFNARLDINDLNLPSGVDVVDIEPSSVTFEFERVINKTVPVELQKINTLPQGYFLEKQEIIPESVIVSGPVSVIDSLNKIYTQEFDLKDFKGAQKMELGFALPSQLLKVNPSTISVELNSAPIIAQQRFEKVNITVIAPNGFASSVEPTKAAVVLVGPKEKLETIQLTKFDLIADSQGLKEGKYEVGLKADLPEDVKILATEPEKVSVILRKQ